MVVVLDNLAIASASVVPYATEISDTPVIDFIVIFSGSGVGSTGSTIFSSTVTIASTFNSVTGFVWTTPSGNSNVPVTL